jgi:hypothetical protein
MFQLKSQLGKDSLANLIYVIVVRSQFLPLVVPSLKFSRYGFLNPRSNVHLFFYLVGLGLEIRASCLQSRCSPLELHLQSIFLWFFWKCGLKTIFLAQSPNLSFPSSENYRHELQVLHYVFIPNSSNILV